MGFFFVENNLMITRARLRVALQAFLIHLGLSAVVAAIVAALILGVWFASPYRDVAGGQHLFWILVSADVICGPLLTAIVFNPKKSRRELLLDLCLIATIQLAALAYGLHAISEARPVVLAFEIDRFVVVSAAQIDQKALQRQGHKLSWLGPVPMGTREPKDGEETIKSIEMSIQGVEPSARPDWWQPYESSKPKIKQRFRKLADLRSSSSSTSQAAIDTAVKRTQLALQDIYYLPLVSSKSLDDWIVLLNTEAEIIGYANAGGF